MSKFIKILLILGLAAGVAYYLPYFTKTVCDKPLSYTIGNFDEEFGITRDQFKNMVLQAEEVWEKALNKELFVYNEEAAFKINLNFDERQAATLEAERSRLKIENKGATYEMLVESYESLKVDFEVSLAVYEDEVNYWNSRGGAPPKGYQQLQEQRNELNKMSADLNALAERINSFARQYNTEISSFNDRFSVPRVFDQGHYDGKQIDIYQFEKEDDLVLVLAHELGHALNLDHVDDNRAIMYHLMKDQRIPAALTTADLEFLKRECRLD